MKTYLFITLIFATFILCSTPERTNPFDENSTIYGPPIVIAQNDTTIDINDSIIIRVIAKDNRGIEKYLWYGAINDTSDTNFIKTSFSDTGSDTIYVKVIDTDGVESNEDSLIIKVTMGVPSLTGINDTIVSELSDFVVTPKVKDVNLGGAIVFYMWDIGGNGWDDTTSDSTYVFSSSIGDTNIIIWGAIDDDGIIVSDTFTLIFNNAPDSASFSVESDWRSFDLISLVGDLGVSFYYSDPDGEDSLRALLSFSEDSLEWKSVYQGSDNETIVQGLKAKCKIYWNLKVFDLLGDSLELKGSFISPDGPPIPDGMKIIYAKDSSFEMGSESGSSNERPIHTVNFTYSFWMDTTEVTQKKYEDIMSDSVFGFQDYRTPNWSKSFGVGDSFPAYFVNWYDAALYCNVLSKMNNYDTIYSYGEIIGTPGNDCELTNITINYDVVGYRLPTEAEWEYACRAGSYFDHFWSGDIDDYAWYSGNSDYEIHPVGEKLPNGNGLYDISGNLWEWCNDFYGSYDAEDATDPVGPLVESSYKVKRGGAWNLTSSYLRSAARNSSRSTSADAYIGFRAVFPE